MSTIEPSAGTPPQPVTTASWLYVAGAVIGLVGAVIVAVLIPTSITSATAATNQLLKNQGAASPAQTTSMLIGVAIAVSVASILLTIGYSVAMLLLAPRMRRGSNRARIALIVLAAVQVIGVFGSYGVGAVHFLVVLAALILSVLPVSNAWFRSVRSTTPTA